MVSLSRARVRLSLVVRGVGRERFFVFYNSARPVRGPLPGLKRYLDKKKSDSGKPSASGASAVGGTADGGRGGEEEERNDKR